MLWGNRDRGRRSYSKLGAGTYPPALPVAFPLTIIDDGPGTGAAYNATVASGVVTAVTMVTAGSGYVNPMVELLGAD